MMKKSFFVLLLSLPLIGEAILIPKEAIGDIQKIDLHLADSIYHNPLFGDCYGIGGIRLRGSNSNRLVSFIGDEIWYRIMYAEIEEDENGNRTSNEPWKTYRGFGGNGDGEFNLPLGFCIDSTAYTGHPNDYYIWLADNGNNRIVRLRYNSSDEEIHFVENISSTPALKSPTDVSCVSTSDGSWVVITDKGNNRIVIFKISLNGTKSNWHSYGSLGSGEGQFKGPLSATIIEGPISGWYLIYVADYGNHRVVLLKMDVSNNWYIQWYKTYTSDFYPSALAATPYDGVYCLDKLQGKVYHFDRGLNRLLETQGSLGSGSGQFLWPRDIAIYEGECGITEEWTNLTGIQYFWLDTEIKNLRADPSKFTPSNWGAGTYLNYILTGGAWRCILKVYNDSYQIVNSFDDFWQYAGENFMFWDGTDSSGNFVYPGLYHLVLEVIDPYGEPDQSDEDYTIQDTDTVDVWVHSYITSQSSDMTAYNTGRKVILSADGQTLFTSFTIDSPSNPSVSVGWATYASNPLMDVDTILDYGITLPRIWFGLYPAITCYDSTFPLAHMNENHTEILYSEEWPYCEEEIGIVEGLGPHYISPPSITRAPYTDTIFVACEYLSHTGGAPPLFFIDYCRFQVSAPVSESRTLYYWADPSASFGYIDTLGVVIGVVPIVWMEPNLFPPVFPIPDTAHITFHVENVPYFAWIRDGEVWVGRVRGSFYGPPWDTAEVINLSESLAVYYGLNLTNCRQITGESYGNMLSIGGIKRGGEDSLFVATHVPNGNIFHYYPSDFWHELMASFLLVGGSSVEIIDVAPPSESMSWPTIRKNTSIVWQKRSNGGNFDVYGGIRDFTDGVWYPKNISESFLDSYYPHSEVWHPNFYSTRNFTLWTEDIGGSYLLTEKREFYYREGYYQTTNRICADEPHNFPIIPYLYSLNGREKPSSFNICRDTFSTFNDKIYGSADIGYDSLFYAFPMLYPDRNYGIMIEFYFEGNSELFKTFIDIDEQVIDTVSIQSGEPQRFWTVLPKSTYQDTQIIIGLKNLQGLFTPCSRIIIYEFGEEDTTYLSRLGIEALRGLRGFKLYQSYPNPTKGSVIIKFQLPVKTSVSLKVYDVSGRLVRTLKRVQGLEPGVYTVRWDGRNDRGLRVPAGVYFYRLKTEEYTSTKKIVLIR